MVSVGTGDSAPVVALVGGGGKTTLLYALARQWAALGRPVITTTTTHILPPALQDSPFCLLLPELEEPAARPSLTPLLASHLDRHGHLTLAREALPNGKLAGFSLQAVDALAELRLAISSSALLLVEADGAAMRPLKAPAPHEPAVPACTTLCLALCGLGGVGQSLGEAVHRPQLAMTLCAADSPDMPVTPEHLAHLCLHPQGLFRTTPAAAGRGVLCVLPEGMLTSASIPESWADSQNAAPLSALFAPHCCTQHPGQRAGLPLHLSLSHIPGLNLARQAALAARRHYPDHTACWWAGSARRGFLISL